MPADVFQSVVEASELEDQGKYDRVLTTKEFSFGAQHDRDAGKTLFWISPSSVFKDEKFFFGPFAYAQFCSKVLGYPHRCLNTEMLPSRLIKQIVDERQNRTKERQIQLKLRQDREYRDTKGEGGKIMLRGSVSPSFPHYSTTSVLKLLQRIGLAHDIEVQGRPGFPDHYFYCRFIMGDTIDIGDPGEPQPIHMGLYLAHSEVGAVSGGMRLDSIIFDETEKTAIVVRPRDRALFQLRQDHKDIRTFEEEVEQSLNSIASSREKMAETAAAGKTKVYDRYHDTIVQICRRFGVEQNIGRKILEAFEGKVKDGKRPTKAAIVSTICQVAREERPDRRFDLECVAGRTMLSEDI